MNKFLIISIASSLSFSAIAQTDNTGTDMNNKQNGTSAGHQGQDSTVYQKRQGIQTEMNQNKNMNRDMKENSYKGTEDKTQISKDPNVSQGTATPSTRNADGIIMKNGKVYKIENGEVNMIENEFVMPNGIKVTGKGLYTSKEGKSQMLLEGQRIDMSGNVIAPVKRTPTDDKNMYLVPDSVQKKSIK